MPNIGQNANLTPRIPNSCSSRHKKSGWQYLGNEKRYQRSVGIKRTKFSGAFQMFKNRIFGFLNSGFLYFWISVFFWISGYISGTKRVTRDPLVSKRLNFQGLFRCSKKYNFWISEFRISKFLDFCIFWDFWLYLGNEKSYQRSVGIKTTKFLRAFQNFEKFDFLDLWITGFLDF